MTEFAHWRTSARLLYRGESITFDFYLPAGISSSDLLIYPRYLEGADPGASFRPGENLDWLAALPSQTRKLRIVDGHATITYKPRFIGSYIAAWQAGQERLFRYFSVVDNESVVLAFSTFLDHDPQPTLHACGIPVDYRLPIEQNLDILYDPPPDEYIEPQNPMFEKFLRYHRCFGDLIVPHFPDTPNLTQRQRLKLYGHWVAKARALIPDEVRAVRVDAFHEFDPGYTKTFTKLGINNHCGLQESNAEPWLGMPEFPYFASPTDYRKANQDAGGDVVAHQWDFCGGWHFLGPVSWHYGTAQGDWASTYKCLRQGVAEFANLAQLSGHPAFAFPLYDGVVKYNGYPRPHFKAGWGGRPMAEFVKQYQYTMAFEFTKQFKVVYARSIDIADYYRRHFEVTPRTVYVSKTDHLPHDLWWLCHWLNERQQITRQSIPWETRISTVRHERCNRPRVYKDPLSCEHVVVEDQHRHLRFERESPNPIWYYDYTIQRRRRQGSSIAHAPTPDVEVVRADKILKNGDLNMRLQMLTTTAFENYAVCIWGLPRRFTKKNLHVKTNAKEYIVAANTDGECHLILFFDLVPDIEIGVTLRAQSQRR